MLNRTFGDLGTQRRVRLSWGEECSVPLEWNHDDDEVDQKHIIFLSSSYGFTETINRSFLIPTILMLFVFRSAISSSIYQLNSSHYNFHPKVYTASLMDRSSSGICINQCFSLLHSHLKCHYVLGLGSSIRRKSTESRITTSPQGQATDSAKLLSAARNPTF